MSELLDAAKGAPGGPERWSVVRSIDMTLNFSAALLGLKRYPGYRRRTALADAYTPRAVVQRLSGDPIVAGSSPRTECGSNIATVRGTMAVVTLAG
jgi:hypothetical protein